MVEKLLTTDELCEWLRVSRTTVWQWRKEGLPYIKTGSLVRFDKAQVQEWLDNRSHKHN